MVYTSYTSLSNYIITHLRISFSLCLWNSIYHYWFILIFMYMIDNTCYQYILIIEAISMKKKLLHRQWTKPARYPRVLTVRLRNLLGVRLGCGQIQGPYPRIANGAVDLVSVKHLALFFFTRSIYRPNIRCQGKVSCLCSPAQACFFPRNISNAIAS